MAPSKRPPQQSPRSAHSTFLTTKSHTRSKMVRQGHAEAQGWGWVGDYTPYHQPMNPITVHSHSCPLFLGMGNFFSKIFPLGHFAAQFPSHHQSFDCRFTTPLTSEPLSQTPPPPSKGSDDPSPNHFSSSRGSSCIPCPIQWGQAPSDHHPTSRTPVAGLH